MNLKEIERDLAICREHVRPPWGDVPIFAAEAQNRLDDVVPALIAKVRELRDLLNYPDAQFVGTGGCDCYACPYCGIDYKRMDMQHYDGCPRQRALADLEDTDADA